MSENLCDLPEERVRSERFQQERVPGVIQSGADRASPFGVAREKKDAALWVDAGDVATESEAIHARHRDVGEEQVDRTGTLASQCHRVVPICCDDQLVAAPSSIRWFRDRIIGSSSTSKVAGLAAGSLIV